MKNFIFCLSVIFLFACQTEEKKEQMPSPWDNVNDILANIQPPQFPDNTFDITEYGAVADSTTDCLPAIKAAIEACHEAGGGKVVVPAGKYYVGGPIHLKSNINLHVSEGAYVKFSTTPSDYLPV
ncbi:MAG: glycoside hydrolase family 28 protein, partial [Bacteroidetes bacterium]|nr:glycoside hydrolase family 28 protein [Bacteroidota bacterium]